MKKFSFWAFCLICLLSVVCFCVFNFAVFQRKYNKFVRQYAAEFKLDSALVFSMIKAESNFDKNAVSSAGAVGLMQLMPVTAAWIASELGEDFQEDDLFDAKTNIRFGCYYLRYLLDKFGDFAAVICAYNAGEGVVRNWLGSDGKLSADEIIYAETKVYYKKVLRFYKIYKANENF